MTSDEFTCRSCGRTFTVPEHVLARYPGWTPQQCLRCRDASRAEPQSSPGVGRNRDTDPASGVFTDGGASPNPGPGGWGVVWVHNDEIVGERWGSDPDTTNNRMELTALIEAADLVPEGEPVVVYADSSLAVNTITQWAAGWEKRGWKRKSGPVENLDLVRKAYYSYRSRPELELRWIKAHAESRWNAHADELANRWRTTPR